MSYQALQQHTELSDDRTQHLNNLIQFNMESSEGLLAAAAIVEEPELQKLFRSCGLTRGQFAKEIRRILRRTDQPQEEDCISVVMHRWWLLLKNTLQADSAFAILSEVERGEKDIQEAYESALSNLAGSDLEKLIKIQYMHVKAVRDRVRRLRQQFSQIEENA